MSQRKRSEYAGKTVKIRALAPLIGGQDYRVEDWWQNVSGRSWMDSQARAAFEYALRAIGSPIDDEVLYGKVDGLGYLVHISEIEVPSCES